MIASNDLLRNLVRGWKGYSRLMEGLAVYYWPRVIGSSFATKTLAEKMMGGTLWVRTEEPTIAHQLSFLIPRILKSYRELMGNGVVKGIRFTVGHIHIQPEEDSINESSKDIKVPLEVYNAAGCIEDDELKDSFLRLAYGVYKRRNRLEEKGWSCCVCGMMKEGSDLCPDCRRKEDEERINELMFLVSKYPHLTFDEACIHIPNIRNDDWNNVRKRLLQRAEEHIVLRAKEVRRAKDKKMISSLVDPCLRFIKLGGEHKELVHRVGMDLWKEIQSMMDKKITNDSAQ